MFQGYEQTLTIPFPKSGINLSANSDEGGGEELNIYRISCSVITIRAR